jgi:hypothetical protein
MRHVGVVALALLIQGPVHAHDDAMWIELGGYLDAAGNRCCGPKDCYRAPAGAIVRTADGWMTPSTGRRWRRGEPGLYPSEDITAWWCVRDGEVYCIFVPPDAM